MDLIDLHMYIYEYVDSYTPRPRLIMLQKLKKASNSNSIHAFYRLTHADFVLFSLLIFPERLYIVGYIFNSVKI